MSRARRSVGPKVWSHLGSSNAFLRALGRFRRAANFSGEGGGQDPEVRGVGCCQGAGSPLPPSSPAGSRQVVPARGRRTVEGHAAGTRKTTRNAWKSGAPSADRRKRAGGKAGTVAAAEEKEDRKEEERGKKVAGGWDTHHLSEKAALAVDAAMWTIATERERTVTCAAITREKNARSQGREEPSPAVEAAPPAARGKSGKARPRTEHATEDLGRGADASMATVTELRVSVPTARRFVKSSGLVDGVSVLDADIDLAFRRWEEARRLAGREPIPTGGGRAVGGAAKGKAEAPCVDPSAESALLQKQRLCEAVGCSDPARYGDFHPMAQARLCRKHRHNGMVDVGSRR